MRKLEITIEYEGESKDYSLYFTRETAKWAENQGFNVVNLSTKPLNSCDILWCASFKANHPEVNPNLALKLLETYLKPVPSGEKDEVTGEEIMTAPDYNEISEFLLEEWSAFQNAPTDTNFKKSKLKIVKA